MRKFPSTKDERRVIASSFRHHPLFGLLQAVLTDNVKHLGTALHTETAFALVAEMLDRLLLGATVSEEEAEAEARGLVYYCLEELEEIIPEEADDERRAAQVYGVVRALQCVLLRTGYVCADTWAQLLENGLREWYAPQWDVLNGMARAESAYGPRLMEWARQYLQTDELLSEQLDEVLLRLQAQEKGVNRIEIRGNCNLNNFQGDAYFDSNHMDQRQSFSMSVNAP